MVSIEMELTEIQKSCYNTNMNTITLTNTLQAADAGQWCSENIAQDSWDLNVDGLFTKHVQYHFSFHDSRHAVEFALRWL